MWIFLDDLRPCPNRFVLAKNVKVCMELLRTNKGNVQILTLDHDLGDEDVKTGYDLVKEMVDEGLYADKIYLHTANGVGRTNMYFYLINAIEHGAIPSHVQIHRGPIVFN